MYVMMFVEEISCLNLTSGTVAFLGVLKWKINSFPSLAKMLQRPTLEGNWHITLKKLLHWLN